LAELGRFLDQALSRQFEWGSWDCLLFPADWARLATGKDPAQAYRGRYRTKLGALRLLGRAGGLPVLSAAQMTAVGFEAAPEPLRGDVGVVLAMTDRGPSPMGAICTGPMWAVLGGRGLIMARYEHLAAWRI
jgi:hypothetical protein